jgi:hypothetical protein
MSACGGVDEFFFFWPKRIVLDISKKKKGNKRQFIFALLKTTLEVVFFSFIIYLLF